MPKFLAAESSKDGDDSDIIRTNPSKSSLLFITTFVNKHTLKILIDTGATTTFINKKVLQHMTNLQYIHANAYSFTLADGIAPFDVLGVVNVSIQSANSTTNIRAHIATRLCTDMIIGMDYINKYNLTMDIIRQTISITNNNHISTMKIDKDYSLRRLPVISSKSMVIPPHSNRSTQVSTPISSICSSFVPTPPLMSPLSLVVTKGFLKFQNYHSNLTLSNTSSSFRFIKKGVCIGFLLCHSQSRSFPYSSFPLQESIGATDPSGVIPETHDSHTCLLSCCNSFSVTDFSGAALVSNVLYTAEKSTCNSFDPSNLSLRQNKLVDFPDTVSGCNTIQSLHPTVEEHLRNLVKKIENKSLQNDLYSLLLRFHSTFDVTKHSIANTPIHHVINTVPHCPPASRPYPQPDKEEAMYKLIEEFLEASPLFT
jgi:hypothetical protein